ncbi:MAG TPA: hypothetical protein VKB23_08070 [Solirubrobacterales bacterium]|nr:hypothetical protein [Solirubrobacterales bacterium]
MKKALSNQLDQPHIRDLARNPMQLTILLSLILTKGASLPDKRTDLYESYLDIFFDREAVKAAVVRDYRDILEALHEYLGWRLHSEAQVTSSGGSIAQKELETEVRTYLESQGADTTLADELFKGMVERVLALVSRVQGRFEFEVQPLREYFAAAFLFSTAQVSRSGDEKKGTIIDRFDGLARDPYWLNVIRFYAGFYNSGQLPSLVFRLKALLDDPEWRWTDRPRTLAAMFLGDYSFAQDRMSREEAIDIALEGIGKRHALAAGPMRPLATRLVLPEGAGREVTAGRVWELLKDSSAGADRENALRLLLAVEGSDLSVWHSYLPTVKGRERTRWLLAGVRTGGLRQISDDDWHLLWDDEQVDDFGKRALWAVTANQGQGVEEDERLSALAVEQILAGDSGCGFDEENPSWLGALAMIMRPYRLFEGDLPFELAEPIDTLLARDSALSPTMEDVRSVVLDVRRLYESDSSPQAILAESIKLVAERWGESWGLFSNGFVLKSTEGRPSRSGACAELSDSSAPILARLQYARAKGGRRFGNWWIGQIENAESSLAKMVCATAALAWPSHEALLEVAPHLGSTLKKLNVSQFRAVCTAVEQLGWSRGAGKTVKLSVDELQGSDLRLAIAFAARDRQRFGKSLYKDYLRSYAGRDPAVLAACLSAATGEFLAGRSTAPTDLQLIRRAYRATKADPLDGSLMRFGGEGIPGDAAPGIVSDASSFPLVLVQAAERRCFLSATAGQPSLQIVAAQEDWFSRAA